MDSAGPKILTALQKEALDLLFSEKQFSKIFYLTGETALSSFFLKHRYSDDLDFFTKDFLKENILTFLRQFEGDLRFSSTRGVADRLKT